jgi:hypothetical protein
VAPKAQPPTTGSLSRAITTLVTVRDATESTMDQLAALHEQADSDESRSALATSLVIAANAVTLADCVLGIATLLKTKPIAGDPAAQIFAAVSAELIEYESLLLAVDWRPERRDQTSIDTEP